MWGRRADDWFRIFGRFCQAKLQTWRSTWNVAWRREADEHLESRPRPLSAQVGCSADNHDASEADVKEAPAWLLWGGTRISCAHRGRPLRAHPSRSRPKEAVSNVNISGGNN